MNRKVLLAVLMVAVAVISVVITFTVVSSNSQKGLLSSSGGGHNQSESCGETNGSSNMAMNLIENGTMADGETVSGQGRMKL